MMDQIYKRARKVWAWLGVSTEQQKLSHLLSLLPSIVTYNRQIGLSDGGSRPERPPELCSIDISYRDAIFHLFQNPWFHRVWIIQEAALATDIAYLCGEHEIDFMALDEALDTQRFTYWNWYDTAGAPVRFAKMTMAHEVLPDIRTFFRSDKIHESDAVAWRPLRVVLLMVPNLDCFSPQDRVFGMIGLLREMDPEIPRFRYDTSVADLYTSFSRYILAKSTRNHFWWRYINMSFSLYRTEGLPSWVPDLHHQRPPYICGPATIREFQRDGDVRYQASLSPSSFELGNEMDEIILRGKILDNIIIVHPTNGGLTDLYGVADHLLADDYEDGDRSVEAFLGLVKWERRIADVALSNELRSDTMGTAASTRVTKDTYWRTLMGNNDFGETPGDVKLTQETWDDFRTTFSQYAQVLRKIHRLLASGEMDPSGKDDTRLLTSEELDIARSTKLQHGAPKAHLQKLWRLAGRQVFHTAQGRFGFTVQGVTVGDLVAVLNGSQTPHVVRRRECRGGKERYSFVGDAYVHGLMYDEAHKLATEEREIVFI
ncbi:hypothetical protein C7974DRAFT_36344 [Boeremia exigua]|uniref:uncharacterized protein n=1 Tax=Boeremia exigua TaxID=749465 RepID=UPI001E8D1F49|nr:uncharacterized protein C7974DRAFT_36344 [Boeremia exigua]KAH6618743.1 hypothetical protein C7974DRAFT_36344 [Boeremia exigua]